MKNLALSLLAVAALVTTTHAQPHDPDALGSKIVYIEYQASDLPKTRTFFERTFGWNFAEQTPTNFTFFDGRIAGGFVHSDKAGKHDSGAPLISIYSENIDETRRKVIANGGRIVRDLATTAEGRRFVFEEPSGNEFAVVSSR